MPKLKFRPGETVKAYVSYRPFRAGEAILPLQLELPNDLADGTYRLSVLAEECFGPTSKSFVARLTVMPVSSSALTNLVAVEKSD